MGLLHFADFPSNDFDSLESSIDQRIVGAYLRTKRCSARICASGFEWLLLNLEPKYRSALVLSLYEYGNRCKTSSEKVFLLDWFRILYLNPRFSQIMRSTKPRLWCALSDRMAAVTQNRSFHLHTAIILLEGEGDGVSGSNDTSNKFSLDTTLAKYFSENFQMLTAITNSSQKEKTPALMTLRVEIAFRQLLIKRLSILLQYRAYQLVGPPHFSIPIKYVHPSLELLLKSNDRFRLEDYSEEQKAKLLI
jgi:hypothetical protein